MGQGPYDETGPWQLFVSNDLFPNFDPATGGIKLLEHFKGAGGPIEGLGWWGIAGVIDDNGRLIECPLEPGEFLIEFYHHDWETSRPDYAIGPVVSLVVSEASGLVKSAAGPVYVGEFDDFTLSYWEVTFPTPFAAFEGWIAVQNLDLCQFWWAASFPGGGLHVCWDEATAHKDDEAGDLSYCLTASDIGPFTGACCDASFGICRNTEATDCAGADDTWYGGLTCTEVTCVADTWACCLSVACAMLDLSACEAVSGEWYTGYVCTTTDPRYDPTAFGGVGNRVICPLTEPCGITCPTGQAFGRSLSGGYLYLSVDRGPDAEQQYVIDNYTGFAAPITRVHWWGNSTIVWEGPDCDFAQPAPFVIKFYPSVGSPPTGPDWENPICTYQVNAEIDDTDYSWTGLPEYGDINCFEARLNPPCPAGTGLKWISIASATEDCDFIWAPGPDGISGLGMWYFDTTLAQPQPGLQHRCFCLYTNVYTGACCNEITGVCQNGQTEDDCAAAGGTFWRSKTCAQIPGGCHAHLGACCDHATGGCILTTAAFCAGADPYWLGKHTDCSQCCMQDPPAAAPEGEPGCFDGYVDAFDAGCDGAPPVFVSLEPGDFVDAAFGTFRENPDGSGAELRDNDWYVINMPEPAVVRVHVRCENALPVASLYQAGPPESPCPALPLSNVTARRTCRELIVSAAVEGGTYYAAIAPDRYDGVPCGTPYLAWLEVVPAGACQVGADCAARSQNVCLALGGDWRAGVPCPCAGQRAGDANCDGAINAFDIDAFVLALADPAAYEAAYPGCDRNCTADVNHDGAVDVFDIDPFVAILVGR